MPPKDCHLRGIDDFNREFKGESFASNRRSIQYVSSHVDKHSLLIPEDFTKYMGVLHVKELQRQLNAEGVPILVTAVHPGVVNTGRLNL